MPTPSPDLIELHQELAETVRELHRIAAELDRISQVLDLPPTTAEVAMVLMVDQVRKLLAELPAPPGET